MGLTLPAVMAYHANIYVETPSGDTKIAAVDMDDWCSDHEVCQHLKDSTGKATIGEAIKAAGIPLRHGIDPEAVHKPVFKWDE